MSEARAGVWAPLLEAQQSLEEAARRLLAPTPEAMTSGLAGLEAARASLEALAAACSDAVAGDRARLWEAVLGMQRQAGLLGALLEQAGVFHLGWARLLGAMIAGYTPQGEPAPLTAAPTFSLEG